MALPPSPRPTLWRKFSFYPYVAFPSLDPRKKRGGDNAEQEVELLEEHKAEGPSRVPPAHTTRFWKLTTFVLLALAILQSSLLILHSTGTSLRRSHGFPTDFPAVAPLVTHTRRRFGHALYVRPNGTVIAASDPAAPPYTGTPSQTIDAAWAALLGRRYFRFTAAEVAALDADAALPAVAAIPPIPGTVATSGVYGGLDFMHSLHCLNALRKHVDGGPVDWGRGRLVGRRAHRPAPYRSLRGAVAAGDLVPRGCDAGDAETGQAG